MARIALRWVIVALIAASLLLVAGIALTRMQVQRGVARAVQLSVPLDNMVVPLNADGVGAQVIELAALGIKLDPYPPRAGAPATVTLVALDRAAGRVMTITPTLSVAEPTDVEGRDYPMVPQGNGAYVASGVFFPRPGVWRLRAHIDFGVAEPYRMLALVEAQ
ncbi:hypothetical protein [Candidatus Roseilinea sp. NK_OTU-006]|uniref:hypothetical protein n=1 Tax=Candidatus Roseilinea sp. NK_OTU-006 TaxID=2704250 RepID=UPI00145FCFB7|nr:hypothetical protein [Candidatus Roseilinea sp. NK_OTU-006]